MSKPSQWVVVCAAIALGTAAFAQEPSKSDSPKKIVTKTLVASEAQKECLSLTSRQRLRYRFQSDGPVNFKISHEDGPEIVDVRRDRIESADGSFAPRKTADHCLVWTNTGKQAVTLRYEFQRSAQ
jgi:hypothetical protein